MTLSDADQRLIALLRENARMPVAQIARRMAVSRTAAQARLAKLERNGVIQGYGLRLSQAHQAQQVRALVLIKSAAIKRAAIEAALAKIAQLVTLYSISGPFDLAAMVAAQSVAALDRVIDEIGRIEGVSDTMSSVILSTRLER